jgi:hypothetical protein
MVFVYNLKLKKLCVQMRKITKQYCGAHFDLAHGGMMNINESNNLNA